MRHPLPPFAFLVALVVLAIGALMVRDSPTRALERALAREAAHGPGHVFALEELTAFDWDRLFVFAPYTSRGSIARRVDIGPTRIEDSDGFALLVFELDGKTVMQLDLPRAPVDLVPLVALGADGIQRADARFVVVEDLSCRRCSLAPAPAGREQEP